ncbi:MAG: response regulator transcription factor [Verrucomicrobia bacterium]|nr:response regulator transcription factor [Verrucomicrobiota bacterium]
MPVRILIVDDHPMLRGSIRSYLGRELPGIEVVGEASESEEAWKNVVSLEPDLVVMDLDIPGIGGIALTQRIRKTYPRMVILVLTAHTGSHKINTALEAGASAYVLKSSTGQELASAVEATLAGQVYLSPAVSTIIVREYQRKVSGLDDKNLTERELETLRGIAEGRTTKEIAFAMKVSAKTVETHRLNLMTKLGINTVAGLTKYALREGHSSL